MNKATLNMTRQNAQAGFTLIELIVVIVILGILAATALPKFSNLGGDARGASLSAVRGALESTSAMVHGQYLTNPVLYAASVTSEGQVIPVLNQYPTASAGFVAGAGITATDYTITMGGASVTAATATAPAIPANGLSIVPNSVANTAASLNCYVTYTQAAASGQPAFAASTTTC